MTEGIFEASDVDPAGFGYAGIVSVVDDQGARTKRTRRSQRLGTIVQTGRTLYPGDRVIFRCSGSDVYGRELYWWLHPHGGNRQREVRGDRVELSWTVQPESVGDRVYAGIGMAAESRYHRHGGPDEQGYDGWVVFYYRVRPAHATARHSLDWSTGRGWPAAQQSRTVHVNRMMSHQFDWLR